MGTLYQLTLKEGNEEQQYEIDLRPQSPYYFSGIKTAAFPSFSLGTLIAAMIPNTTKTVITPKAHR
jgi:hypothetical protein